MRANRPRPGRGPTPVGGGCKEGAAASLAPIEFARAVHDLLNHFHDPAYVQTHPLAQVARNASESPSKPAGQILRRDVLAAIESLQASGEDANGKKGRGFQILTWRYVDGLSIEEVRHQLAISHSTYYREYQRGVQAVVSVLRTAWGVSEDLVSEPAHVQLVRFDRGEGEPGATTPFQVHKGIFVHLTKLIGRERELADVTRLLSTTRLLTLTGTGGCGKTRLARQLAEDLATAYPDGVWFVELAPVADPAFVPQTVAGAVGVSEQLGQSIVTTLRRALRDRNTLLILDNCEHLIDACARLVDELLPVCPELQILTTSRETLGIAGEVRWRVPSLSFPLTDDPLALEKIAESDAIRLFLDRAAAVRPNFDLSEHNAPFVAQICRRLDGIPLAIEMAATRLNALSVEQIVARLNQRFRLLTGGNRVALPRHQTLRGLVDWSFDLLSEPERTLFRRLAVFVGGFTLESAEAVCGDAVDGIATHDVLDRLVSLVSKSLVVVEEEPEKAPRFWMLEIIREYAWERLNVSLEADRLGKVHADHYVEFAEEAATRITSEASEPWIARLHGERLNLRAALQWSSEREGWTALRLAGSLWRFWWRTGTYSEGRHWLSVVLTHPVAHEASRERARALTGAGWFDTLLGENESARQLGFESFRICQAIGERWEMARALDLLGNVAHNQGDYTGAIEFETQSVALCQEVGDIWGCAWGLICLGLSNSALGDFPIAEAVMQEGLILFRDLGDAMGIGFALGSLGGLAFRQGDLMTARALAEESLVYRRRTGDPRAIAVQLQELASVALGQHDLHHARGLLEESVALANQIGRKRDIARARCLLGDLERIEENDAASRAGYRESLVLSREVGDRRTALRCCLGLAGIAVARQEPARAARLLGAAEMFRVLTGERLGAVDQRRDQTYRTAAQNTLGDHTFELVFAEGRSQTQEQAIDYALGSDPAQIRG